MRNLRGLGRKSLLLVDDLLNGVSRLGWIEGDAAELRVSWNRHCERGDSANESQTASCGELLHEWKLLERGVDAMVCVGGDEDVFADVDPRSRTFLERDDRQPIEEVIEYLFALLAGLRGDAVADLAIGC